MTVTGADPDQLRTTASQFVQAADRLQSSMKWLNGFVSNAAIWRGPDSERFRSEWNGQSVFALNAAINALRSGADVLRRNADEQEDASRADGGGGAGGAGSGSMNSAPEGASALYNAIRTLDESHDGVMIQEVVGPDGKTRLVVYLAGTDLEDSKRDPVRNLKLAGNWIDDETTAKIDRALRAAGYDPADCSTQPEMMFVGFSQGGMEAQNLVASGRYNATALVTYGSPLVHADVNGVSTVHLRARGDNTPNIPAEALALARRDLVGAALLRADVINGPGDRVPLLDPLSGESKNLFVSDSGTTLDWSDPFKSVEPVLTGNHGDRAVYTDVGADFDKSTDPKFASQKAVMDKFEGTVTRTTEGSAATDKGTVKR
jgi:uncharacterized protein YukE